ncbi:MAG: hypothetical protein OEY14_06370, partial [Myxococcales bacterium]|nr:hypothetical protein [Myxococcales bacterium]
MRVRTHHRVTAAIVAALTFLTLGTPLAARAQEAGASSAEPAAGEGAASGEPAASGEAVMPSQEFIDEYGDLLDPSRVAGDVSELDPELAAQLERSLEAGSGGGAPPGAETLALPVGESKSAVTPQAISLPTAEGSVEGMGESFAPVLSSGTGTFSVPIALPAGRAGVQPSLGLAYSTSGGNGAVGFGWGLAAPFIGRQSDRGMPRYQDGAAWHAEEDRYLYNGGQELVPVDTAAMAAVDESGLGYETSAVPAEVGDWQQYRARVEGGFMRFFRSPDSSRWVVQGKDGTRLDFGLLPAGEGPSDLDATSSLQTEDDDPSGRVAVWHLTRMSDAHGSTVYYEYGADQGERYLEEVHYLSPASCAAGSPAANRACSAPLSEYGVRVGLEYEGREDVYSRYSSGWRVATARRL